MSTEHIEELRARIKEVMQFAEKSDAFEGRRAEYRDYFNEVRGRLKGAALTDNQVTACVGLLAAICMLEDKTEEAHLHLAKMRMEHMVLGFLICTECIALPKDERAGHVDTLGGAVLEALTVEAVRSTFLELACQLRHTYGGVVSGNGAEAIEAIAAAAHMGMEVVKSDVDGSPPPTTTIH